MSYLRNQPYDEKDFPAFAVIREQLGFLPNFFLAQTARPDMIDAEMTLTGNLLLKEGALARRQKEYIFLVCSAANLSTYCVTAHCEIVRMLRLEGPEPEQIAIDYVHAKIPVADKALLNFCSKLNGQASKIGPSDVEALRTYGFSEQQILEAVLLVGWAKFANTVAFGLGTVPDFENRRIAEELGKARAENRETQVPA
ncbi:MAG: peroxidase-related enzyme [Candidatus Sulfotelmatobacter sp.]